MTEKKEELIAGLPARELFASGHRACAGCGEVLALRHFLKAAGPNTIVVSATGCMEVVSTPYPETAWKVPWIHAAFENAASVASGVDAALRAKGKREGINLIATAGDGSTFDIGFQAISGALERGHKFTYICTDNEAYMNCLSTDSLILTKTGLKKITEVKRGEMVYAFNIKSRKLVLKKCTGVFDNGRKVVFDVQTLHHNIKATGNHPFLVLQHNGKSKESSFVWTTVEELRKGDEVVVLKRGDKGKSYRFPKLKKVKKGDYKVNKLNEVRVPKKTSPDIMEYLGIYLGDGWTREKRGEIGFAVPKRNRARKRLISLQKKLFRLTPKTDDNYVYVNSVNLARFMASLGFGKGAKNKVVPAWVFTLPEKEKEAFVEGLMLSDGYKLGKSWRYVSASNELLRGLRLLLQTMNRRVGKIHQQTKKKGSHCVYRKLLNDCTYGYICFSRKKTWNTKKYPSQFRCQNFLINNRNFDIEKIQKINKVGVEATLDLRVAGEHNFIADGFVVHNTGIQRSSATFPYASTTTSPAGKVIHGKQEPKKPLPFIIAAHGIRYVATMSLHNLVDFHRKVKKALETEGPSFLHTVTPCTPGWGIDTGITIKLTKLAVETGVQPMYEIENGVVKFTQKVENRKPVEEYLKLQGRFKHLTPDLVGKIQKYVDERYNFLLEVEGKKIFDVLY